MGAPLEAGPPPPPLLYIQGGGHPIDTQVDLLAVCGAPSIVIHLGHIIVVLRRSPTPVTSSSPSSRPRADETLPRPHLDQEYEGHHRAECVQITEVSCVRYLDRLDRKDVRLHQLPYLTLPLSVYEGTGTHSPLSLLCMTMILRVRRNFFEITTLPTVASEPRFYALMLYARVEHK